MMSWAVVDGVSLVWRRRWRWINGLGSRRLGRWICGLGFKLRPRHASRVDKVGHL